MTQEIKNKVEISSVIPKGSPKEIDKGREEDYFFPGERITIRATSMEEALKKLKELK